MIVKIHKNVEINLTQEECSALFYMLQDALDVYAESRRYLFPEDRGILQELYDKINMSQEE